MAHRAVDAQRPALIRPGLAGLGVWLAAFGLGAAPDREASSRSGAPTAAKAPPIESRPYKIRAWVAIAPGARLDGRGRDEWVGAWRALVRRFVGPAWDLEVAEGDGPLAAAGLDALTPESLAPLTSGCDKAWALVVEPARGGFALAGREYDVATGRLGLACRRPVAVRGDAPRTLLRLALEMFCPTAEIVVNADSVRVKVQGGMLPAPDPIGRVVSVGSVFQPTYILYKPDGGVARIRPVARTYLRVQGFDGPLARCEVISQLRTPLTRMVAGRYKVVALGSKPASVPTRLRFVTPKPDSRPAAGYALAARRPPDGAWRELGTTDREGRVVLPPDFAEGLMQLRVLAGGVEPLDEFPLMPGEVADERTIILDTRPATISLESRLNALRDEVVEMALFRRRIEAKLRARAEGEDWDEVKALLEEYRTLPGRPQYEERLDAMESQAEAEQGRIKRVVLTRTAQNLLAETRGMLEKYLDDEEYHAYEDALNRYAAGDKSAKPRPRKPAADPNAALAGVVPPSASGAADDEAKAGLVEYVSPGGRFRVASPTVPIETTAKVGPPNDLREQHVYTASDPARGEFRVAWTDYPARLASEESAARKNLDAERDRTLGRLRGSKLLAERPALLEAYPGREVELDTTPPGGVKSLLRMRAFLVDKRLYTVSVSGTEAQVRARPAEVFLDSFRLATSPPTPAAIAPQEPRKVQPPAPAPAKAQAAVPQPPVTAPATANPPSPASPDPSQPAATPEKPAAKSDGSKVVPF